MGFLPTISGATSRPNPNKETGLLDTAMGLGIIAGVPLCMGLVGTPIMIRFIARQMTPVMNVIKRG